MYLGSENVVVDLIYDWFDVVLSYQRCLMDDSWTYQDIGTELVGFILDGCVLLRDDSPDISSGFSNTLHISFLHKVKCPQAYINERSREILALFSKLLQLLEKSMRDVRRGLNDGRSPCSESGVDFSGPVDNIMNHRRGMLEPRSDSLFVSSCI
jgi:hypothetical protein